MVFGIKKRNIRHLSVCKQETTAFKKYRVALLLKKGRYASEKIVFYTFSNTQNRWMWEGGKGCTEMGRMNELKGMLQGEEE